MDVMQKFTYGQRVIDDYLGAGTVVKQINSSMDNNYTVAYMVRFDKTPDVRYNMGENPTMVFPVSLRVEANASLHLPEWSAAERRAK